MRRLGWLALPLLALLASAGCQPSSPSAPIPTTAAPVAPLAACAGLTVPPTTMTPGVPPPTVRPAVPPTVRPAVPPTVTLAVPPTVTAAVPPTAKAPAPAGAAAGPPGPAAARKASAPAGAAGSGPAGPRQASASPVTPPVLAVGVPRARVLAAPAGFGGLPELALPCYADRRPVRLDQIRGPAVLNLWASWCPPCRAELPAFQRFADRTVGRVHVLGVISGDSRDAAGALAIVLKLRFPAVWDDSESLKKVVGGRGYPVTVLVDGAGLVRHTYNGPALDDRGLAELVERYLGVRLP